MIFVLAVTCEEEATVRTIVWTDVTRHSQYTTRLTRKESVIMRDTWTR